jgi:hypothetical protein
MLSFIKNRFTHETAIAHNGHVIVIEQGWFIRPVAYLDDERMLLVAVSPEYSVEEYYRYAKATTDDGNEVTYSVLLRPKLSGNSIIVEVFDGGSWHGQTGQLIYSS